LGNFQQWSFREGCIWRLRWEMCWLRWRWEVSRGWNFIFKVSSEGLLWWWVGWLGRRWWWWKGFRVGCLGCWWGGGGRGLE